MLKNIEDVCHLFRSHCLIHSHRHSLTHTFHSQWFKKEKPYELHIHPSQFIGLLATRRTSRDSQHNAVPLCKPRHISFVFSPRHDGKDNIPHSLQIFYKRSRKSAIGVWGVDAWREQQKGGNITYILYTFLKKKGNFPPPKKPQNNLSKKREKRS